MKKLLGGILMAIGILIAGASGLCSLVFLVSSLNGGAGDLIVAVLLFGGMPFAVGLVLFFTGRGLVRSARKDETDA